MKLWLLASLLVFVSACADEGQDHSAHMGGGEQHPSVTFGEAGDPDEADRTIEVEAVDSLKFDPASLEVEEGETVTFVVSNTGQTDHEFVLGDEAYQESHGGAVMDHEEGNGVFLEPGDTAEVTWTFSDAGGLIYACHVNGHFDSGMSGRIEIR